MMAAKVFAGRGATGAARACCNVIGVRGAVGERSELTGNAPDIIGTARNSADAMGRSPPKTVEARVGAIGVECGCGSVRELESLGV